MLKKFVVGLVALGSLGFLLAADDHTDTWKLNEAKSKFAKGHEAKDVTTVIAFAGDTVTVTAKGTGGFFGAGKPFSVKFTVPVGGGPLTYIEGAPPAGITDVLKKIDDLTSDIITTMDGKQVFMQHIAVSEDHKTMISTESGMDEKGQAFKSVEVFDYQ